MRLFNITTKEIEQIELIQTDEVTLIVSRLSDEELISYGYKRVIEAQTPDDALEPYKKLKSFINEESSVCRVTYTFEDIGLEEAKALKLVEIKEAITKDTQKCICEAEGIGEVDAGNQYMINIAALISVCEASGQEVDFRMADNTTKKLNLEQLNKIKAAIGLKGLSLYHKKWELEEALNNAKSIDEVKEIKWS
ncbi:MAG: DUF4376 domain-containing protein [Campylobacter sp.]|nr:DUF4376 domain-containing protein [Campylobacter sp.]